MPEISVIIPAYNSEETIVQTIKTVIRQTFHDFELIVIDDGSKDKTPELVHSIKDDRIKLFSYENGGLPTARNRGMTHSNGEFIAFLDADDLWTPDKLELQLAALKQSSEAGLAYSWTYFMDINERGEAVTLLPSPSYSFEGDVYEKLLVSDFIHSGSNTLIRRQTLDSVGNFDSTLKSCEDWDYWLRVAASWHFVVVPKHQVFYRRSPNSMSSKVEVMRREALIAMGKAYKSAPADLQHLKRHTLANLHKYCAGLYLQRSSARKDIWQAWQDLSSAIRIRPQNLLDRTTQKLLIKLLVKQVLPGKAANSFLQFIRKPAAINNSRLLS